MSRASVRNVTLSAGMAHRSAILVGSAMLFSASVFALKPMPVMPDCHG